MEKAQKKVVVDFIKAFSCAYSVTKNLGLELEVETDPLLLRSVVGFSSGISTMGDTCGVANGGVAVLGKKYSDLPSDRLYLLCAEYFRRLESRVGTPNCGVVHGGKHLARNFRRAILTGKTIKCVEVLAHCAQVLKDFDDLAREKDFSFGELSESARSRGELLERLLPRLKIAARCELAGRFLRVRGDVRTYRIHLGSGNVLMEPNDEYLCIVQDRSTQDPTDKTGGPSLPFEGDRTLSVILSKALMNSR